MIPCRWRKSLTATKLKNRSRGTSSIVRANQEYGVAPSTTLVKSNITEVVPMERLDLYGMTAAQAHHAFIQNFWDDFGIDGHKTSRSPKSKDVTLARLILIGTVVVLRDNDKVRNKINRCKFDRVKSERHSLRSHKICFACGAKAAVRHHIIWVKHGGLNSKRNLVSLCRSCHAAIHPWLLKAS